MAHSLNKGNWGAKIVEIALTIYLSDVGCTFRIMSICRRTDSAKFCAFRLIEWYAVISQRISFVQLPLTTTRGW